MLEAVLIRLYQLAETYRDEGVRGVSRKSLPVKETAVKTRLALEKVKKRNWARKKQEERCLELSLELLDTRQVRYGVRSRFLKARRNLRRGYKGFVLADTGEVMGDVWYVENRHRSAVVHPDLIWLDIQLGPDEIYMYDMFLMKEHRGGGTARLLMEGALAYLKERGYRRAYGYYITKNIPALWTHRMLGYEELSRIEVKRRFGRYKRLKEQQAVGCDRGNMRGFEQG